LARGVKRWCLYKLLVDHVALVHASEKLGEPSSFEEAYAEHVWWDAMEIGSKPIVESMIDSKLALMGVLKSTKDKVVGFS
jgi:hypothetical protein